jgi:hypothetical protein
LTFFVAPNGHSFQIIQTVTGQILAGARGECRTKAVPFRSEGRRHRAQMLLENNETILTSERPTILQDILLGFERRVSMTAQVFSV